MASLQQLLTQEGFKHSKPLKRKKQATTSGPPDSVTLPIYICHGSHARHKSFDFYDSKHQTDKASLGERSSMVSSKRASSDTERSKSMSFLTGAEPAIDDVAIRAVISILSGYIGRYKNDGSFREMIRDKCNSCLVRRKKDSDDEIFANIELGMESVEKLVEDQGTRKEMRINSLRNSIQLLSIVASLNSKNSRNGSTCGVPNSYLSACAQLYLSIVYKLDKNDRISARHLLQVFCDSPSLARTHLLSDLWEHFILPHLLHLKIWYHKQVELLQDSRYGDREFRIKALNKLYNDQMDMGTWQFALYYNEWLKAGSKAPPIPAVPLPSTPSYPSRRRSSDSYTSNPSINRNFACLSNLERYRAVFGPTLEDRSMGLDSQNGASMDTWGLEEENERFQEEQNKYFNIATSRTRTVRRSSSQNQRNSSNPLWHGTQKSDYFKLYSCQNVISECLVNGNYVVKSSSIKKENAHRPLSGISRAISTICSSDSLTECESSLHVIVKAWLDSHGDPAVEGALSKAPVIEGMLEILFGSNDDEILELAISLLAELAARKEGNRLIILNSDPQLEIFIRLLKSSSLFLKAAVLLYVLKPKAKQMISNEWVTVVLRVLDFGDQLQTLFTVRYMPQKAALYLLDQLLTGFNEDRNLENASQVVSLGGLALLARIFEIGDVNDKNTAATLMSCCILADGSSRRYLAANLNKSSLLQLIVLGIQSKFECCAFIFLTELLCLNRQTQIIEFLTGLVNVGWGGLNTMHIFLVYLQRASPEERPLVAAVLLLLDLMGDPFKPSLFREEAVEAIIEALDCHTCNSEVQEQCARALLMLGGFFSYTEEPTTEEWLLNQANPSKRLTDSLHSKEIVCENLNEEEDATKDWQRKVTIVLLNSGGTRFLAALSNSIANGIPNLAQAGLFTVAWMNRTLVSPGSENFRYTAQIESSYSGKALDGSSVPSFSLQNFIKSSECVTMLSTLDKELIGPLRNSI